MPVFAQRVGVFLAWGVLILISISIVALVPGLNEGLLSFLFALVLSVISGMVASRLMPDSPEEQGRKLRKIGWIFWSIFGVVSLVVTIALMVEYCDTQKLRDCKIEDLGRIDAMLTLLLFGVCVQGFFSCLVLAIIDALTGPVTSKS